MLHRQTLISLQPEDKVQAVITNLWNNLGYEPKDTLGNFSTVSLRIVAIDTSSAVT